MSGKDSEKIIDKASPHTVKKFELVEGYIESWKEILLQTSSCEELIFIDCMSSSGEYTDIDGKLYTGLHSARINFSGKQHQDTLTKISVLSSTTDQPEK